MDRRFPAGLVAFALGLAGCAPFGGGRACPAFVALGPIASLDYPIASATGVPDDVGILIFSGASRQKIVLMPGSSGATPIATEPTALPSPLPSPISPPESTTYGYFAVSVPLLSPATTYQAEGYTDETYGCGGTSMVYAGGGSFTTH